MNDIPARQMWFHKTVLWFDIIINPQIRSDVGKEARTFFCACPFDDTMFVDSKFLILREVMKFQTELSDTFAIRRNNLGMVISLPMTILDGMKHRYPPPFYFFMRLNP